MPRPAVLPTVSWDAILEKAMSYQEWLAAAEFAENAKSMEDTRKAITLTESDRTRLDSVGRVVHVLAFAEDWCGDVVRHVPVLEKIAEFSPKVVTRYLYRDQAPEVFIRFLTNGGEAVPKFVFLSEALVECGNWGPMPQEGRKLIAQGKACGDVSSARVLVHERYQADPQQREVVEELISLLELASSERVRSS